MAEDIIFRSILAALFSLFVSLWFHRSLSLEQGKELRFLPTLEKQKAGKDTSVVSTPLVLPVMMATVFAAELLLHGWSDAVGYFIALSVDTGILLSLFYVPLLPVMPLLRRRFSNRFCAAAWLLPSVLYLNYSFFAVLTDSYAERNTLLTLSVPGELFALLPRLWLAGFLIVFGGKLLLHLRFRHSILSPARPVTEERVLSLWNAERERAVYRAPVRLVVSPAAASPLSMGLWNKTRVVVLPENKYSDRALFWIFRHELRHLQRCDVDTKVFFGFAVTFCWFNPLVWIAVRRAAQDMELSCDEAVLEGMEQADRREYANLLLDTAWDGRGFTTCLSATAGSLRYRLKNIVAPRSRRTGTVLLGVLMFLCVMGFGLVMVTTDRGELGDTLLRETDSFTDFVRLDTAEASYALRPGQEAALLDYLKDLEAERLVSTQRLEPEGGFVLNMATEKEWLMLTGNILAVRSEQDWQQRPTYYILDREVSPDALRPFFQDAPIPFTIPEESSSPSGSE